MHKIKRGFFSLILLLIFLSVILNGCMQQSSSAAAIVDNTDESALEVKTNEIRQANIASVIEELCSEKYKGRLAGTEENQLTAQYIADYFKNIGLETPAGLSNYMQPYTQAVVALTEKPVLQIIDKSGQMAKDFDYPENFVLRRLSSETDKIDIAAPMYLLEDPNILRNNDLNLEGKMILLPWSLYDLTISQNEPLDLAKRFNALGVISEFDLARNDLGYSYLKVRPLAGSWVRTNNYKPFAFVDSDTFAMLSKSAKEGSKLRFSSNSSKNVNSEVNNVVGIIPGSDPLLKDDCIIIAAHFDHIGDNMDGTYNPGAQDNASGVAAMLELAKTLKENNMQPKKSIVFIAFNGEESGCLGSWYYAGHPVYPLDKSVMINMDMIGTRTDTPLSIAAISPKSVSDLGNVLAKYADKLGINYEKSSVAGSDHAVFDDVGVPAVCLANLEYRYGYHSPKDTVEVVDNARIQEVIELVLYYLEQNAN